MMMTSSNMMAGSGGDRNNDIQLKPASHKMSLPLQSATSMSPGHHYHSSVDNSGRNAMAIIYLKSLSVFVGMLVKVLEYFQT